jgi:hypothetical protein
LVGDFAMKFLRATQRSSDPTTDPPQQEGSHPTIQRGIPAGIHHQSEVDRTGAVERPDVRMLRYPVLLGPLR